MNEVVPTLTEAISRSLDAPIEAEVGYDVHTEFGAVLSGVGISTDDIGGTVSFRGVDPIVPSTLRLGAAAAIGLAAKSAAVAALWRDRTGSGQAIDVDLRTAPHRLCPFYDRKWELINGHAPRTSSNPSQALGFTFHRTADGRWVMPLNPYPRIKIAAQKLLGTPDDAASVSDAISLWRGSELEEAGADAGVVMPLVRTAHEFMALDQYRHFLADAPLVEVTPIGPAAAEPLHPRPASPLDGVRALGMGHVIAGAGTGRALALHGADVLNLWRPDELEHDSTYATANVGMRSAFLDIRSAEDHEKLRSLLADADVFFANRRPGMLEHYGLSPEEAAELRPGIIYATNSLNGLRGPWARRVGFDQTAGSLVGMMTLEGGDGPPQLPPILVVNDYIVSWLTTMGIISALRRRAVDGGSYRVHVSLTRVALWILSLGVFDREYAYATAGVDSDHAYLDPETFTAQTPLGLYQGVTDQVRMSATPGDYRHVLLPRGSCRPEWEAR
ncbi:CoA transferase [Mycolicibacterium hodleri]|uniref:CoA transferase n=1 Tax=Mycolicibacterium hodleri TaxID=49897 RepID=UPI001F2EA176|nr:CoA transferase [Mycolicibacterium hodleri]